jgi:hypothetical protein
MQILVTPTTKSNSRDQNSNDPSLAYPPLCFRVHHIKTVSQIESQWRGLYAIYRLPLGKSFTTRAAAPSKAERINCRIDKTRHNPTHTRRVLKLKPRRPDRFIFLEPQPESCLQKQVLESSLSLPSGHLSVHLEGNSRSYLLQVIFCLFPSHFFLFFAPFLELLDPLIELRITWPAMIGC